MIPLLPCQQRAIDLITANARDAEKRDREAIATIGEWIQPDRIIEDIFRFYPITVNFHPDRLVPGGEMILHRLLRDGTYQNQYATGTTNGGKTAYAGGERDLWERRLFAGAYHKEETFVHRPKYGALNLLNFIDGAAPRFGSCYFVLRPPVAARCTFSYGDSVVNPEYLGSYECFIPVLRAMLEDIQANARLLNQQGFTVESALAALSGPETPKERLGRNLDQYIETHIHGPLDLFRDVESLFLDESYQDSALRPALEELSAKYGFPLRWIPQRQVRVEDIGGAFRGEAIPPLARRIGNIYRSGALNAEILGRASVDSVKNENNWREFGGPGQLFQYFKQLWHTIAFFG